MVPLVYAERDPFTEKEKFSCLLAISPFGREHVVLHFLHLDLVFTLKICALHYISYNLNFDDKIKLIKNGLNWPQIFADNFKISLD